MRHEYIEPFVNTALRVVDRVIHCDITMGATSLVKSDMIDDDVAIIVGLQGDSDGSIVLSMPAETALGLCSAMFVQEFETLSPAGMDAIAELANMIAGNTMSVLNDMGFDFRVSAPVVTTKNSLTAKTLELEAFQLPLFTEYGEIIINVVLRTN
jgi:chemotaxis protein CheX